VEDEEIEKLLKLGPERVREVIKQFEEKEEKDKDEEEEEDEMEVVTCRMRLGYLFSWVPFLDRLGWWRWLLLYTASIFLIWGPLFKAYLFWFVMQVSTRPSLSEPIDYIGLEKSTVVLSDDVPQELSYEALTNALFLIYNGNDIHVSQCFWCIADKAHFWGGVIGSGVLFVSAAVFEAIKYTILWSVSFCDENITASNRLKRKRQEKIKREKKKPWISGPRFNRSEEKIKKKK